MIYSCLKSGSLAILTLYFYLAYPLLDTKQRFLNAIALPQPSNAIAQAPKTSISSTTKNMQNQQPEISFVDYFAEERQLKGHEGTVNSANFSPDNKYIVTASSDGNARVWDFSGKFLAELQGHSGNVKSASFSADSKLIVTASFDGTARIWNLSGKQLAELKGHQGNVNSANFSPDGKRVATVGADGIVRFWDTTGKQLGEIKAHLSSIYSVSFSPDGKRIATAGADGTAQVWDLFGKLLVELKGHTDTVWSASFSPDGQRIVTTSDDKTARVWDLSGKHLAELKGHNEGVYSANFSPDGKQIVTGSVEKTAIIWDTSGEIRAFLKGHQGSVSSAKFSPDGKFIVTASVDGTARVWDTTKKLLSELRIEQTLFRKFKDAGVSPNGKLIIIASPPGLNFDERQEQVFIWDLSNRRRIELKDHQKKIRSASLSLDQQKILTVSEDRIARLWDTSGNLLTEIQDIFYSVEFSEDGKYIVADSLDTVRLWDTSGKLITELKDSLNFEARYSGKPVSVSPNGKLIVTASEENKAYVWNISGQRLAELKGHQKAISSVSFSPDSKLIVTASEDKTARVWDISGNLMAELKGHPKKLRKASFSPDGKLIFTSSEDYTTRIWTISGEEIHELSGGYSGNFSSYGNMIVTDGNIRLWNTSGNFLAELGDGDDPRFSPDGKHIITIHGQGFLSSDLDSMVRVWYLSNESLAQFKLLQPEPSPEESEIKCPGRITSASFSPDGKLIATASYDGNAYVWNFSGELQAVLRGHKCYLTDAKFSPDGKLIVTASKDLTAKVWDTSGKFLAELRGHNCCVNSASFSPDGKQIVTTSEDETVRVWDTKGKQLLVITGHEDMTNSANFSPDGKLIVSASNDETARVWDLSGKQILELKGHDSSVTDANFSPDGKLIVTASWDDTARIWDLSGKQLAILKGHEESLDKASFSPDGKRIITASDDGTARVWDLSGKQLAILKGHREDVVSANFSPNGKRIVTASDDGTARTWDISGKLLTEILINQTATSTIFSPDGQLIMGTFSDATTRIWDYDGKLLAELKGHEKKVNDASFSPNGKLIVTASDDKTARLWDNSGNQLGVLKGHEEEINSIDFSADAKMIVTASSDGIGRIWDTSGRLLAELKEPQSDSYRPALYSASFSPDGKLVVTESSDEAHVWDVSGKLLTQLKGNQSYIASVNFSPDSKQIITAHGDAIARVWDISGNLLLELKGHQKGVTSANFSPDGKLIITTSEDGTTRIWDTSGKQLAEINHEREVNSASFSFDGKFILTTSRNIARVWNTSGELIAELKGHVFSINNANFSPDGKYVATASDDGTVRLWNLSGKLLQTLGLPETPSSLLAQADNLQNLEFPSPNCALALEPLGKALKIYQEIGDKENESLMYQKLGSAKSCLSKYTEAINDYSKSFKIAEEYNYSKRQVNTLLNWGNVYSSLAEYDKANKNYEDALKIIEREKYFNPQIKVEILRSKGDLYNQQGKNEEALKYYLKGLSIDEQEENADSLAKTKAKLANIYYSSGDYTKAIQYYTEALKYNRYEALIGLGNVSLAQGNNSKSIKYYNRALIIAQHKEDKEAEGIALNNIANALRKSGQEKLPESEKHLYAAIEIWEKLRTNLDDTNKISIFEKQAFTYHLLQQVLIAQGKISEALEIAERGRTRAFAELLTKRITSNQTQEKIELFNIESPNIDQIKQIAKIKNTTLVQYSIITDEFQVNGKTQKKESELYIWVIKPTGEVTFRNVDLKPLWQKDGTNLSESVNKTRLSIGVVNIRSRQAGGNITNQTSRTELQQESERIRLQRLHELLIQPIADILPNQSDEHIIFIPHDSLFLVPFPALQDAQGKYLLEKHTILTAPSIQILDLIQKQKAKNGNSRVKNGEALVVGNPIMPSFTQNLDEEPKPLPQLQGAENEVLAIAPILNTKAITGSAATKTKIIKKMPQAPIIHLATHGLFDDLQGLKSAIALAPSSSPSNKKGKEESDGWLTAEEILNLNQLSADLVVLSACDTGRGKITGDGVIGLSRSLISVGVPSVVVSLWSIDDNSTAFLMTKFYENRKHFDKATALRKAMLATKEKYSSPLQWAAFTLIGEAE